MSDPILRAHELSCRFGGVQAVDTVSLDILPGISIGIIGPNGAGKTTFFNLISGHIKPSSGHVEFCGQRIVAGKPHRIARAGMGRTFQTVRVFGELSVQENLRIGDFLSATEGTGDFRFRADEVLDLVGMSGFADHDAGLLSYGQRKLIELAMVLINRPRMILLDEPVSGVNPALIGQIVAVLDGVKKRGITVAIVEHNVPFVIETCERVIVMANGCVLADGSGAEIQKDARVLEAYLGG